MDMTTQQTAENRLLRATLFTFFVSGACSLLMGNLMPFLRELYAISYSRAGLLLSLPSWGCFSVTIDGKTPGARCRTPPLKAR